MRIVLLILSGSLIAVGAFAQRLPLAIAVGAKVADNPQVSLHLYPSERFEIAFAGYKHDEIGEIADNFVGSVSVLARFRAQDPLSIRAGVNYTFSEKQRLQEQSLGVKAPLRRWDCLVPWSDSTMPSQTASQPLLICRWASISTSVRSASRTLALDWCTESRECERLTCRSCFTRRTARVTCLREAPRGFSASRMS